MQGRLCVAHSYEDMFVKVDEMRLRNIRLVLVLDSCAALWFFYWTFVNEMVIWRKPLAAALSANPLNVTSLCISILFLILLSWKTGLSLLGGRNRSISIEIDIKDSEGGGEQRRKTTKITVLLVVFTILTVVSVPSVYFASQMPLEREETLVLCGYRHLATYDYTAILEPNVVYEKLTLKPGEGNIYRRITDQIDISLAYSFETTLPANMTVNAIITETLKVAEIEKQLSNTWTFKTNATGTMMEVTFDRIEPLQISTINELVNNITKEIGVGYAKEYEVNINSEIDIEANTSEGLIRETFTPSLVFTFGAVSGIGLVIEPSVLQHMQTGSITRTERISQNSPVATWYMASMLLSMTSVSGLAYMAYVFRKTKLSMEHRSIDRFIEEIVEPYEEIIVEANEAPSDKGETNTRISSLEDLVRIADIIGRPVLHVQKPLNTHAFFVIDGATIYEYAITAQLLAEPEEVLVEPGEENER